MEATNKIKFKEAICVFSCVIAVILWAFLGPFRWAPIIIASISSISRVLLKLHELKTDKETPKNNQKFSIIRWGLVEFSLEILGMWFINYCFAFKVSYLTFAADMLGYILGVVIFIIARCISLKNDRFDRASFLIESMWLMYMMIGVTLIYGAVEIHKIISHNTIALIY